MKLNDSIALFKKVGKTTVKYLGKLGIKTVADLLFHFPLRYDDFRKASLIAELKD